MRALAILAAAVCIVATACATSPAPGNTLVFEIASVDPARDAVMADAAQALENIENFFGEPFVESVRIAVSPDRAHLDAALPAAWGVTPTQCWMVGVGVADRLELLSPGVWKTQACEHDGGDAQHVQGVIAHELTHAFHGQHNPTRDFTGMDDLGWFVEGLAVLVSGQMERQNGASARDALAANAGPASLASAWSGRYRYGVSGSIVAYVDAVWGRSAIRGMLADTTQAQVLARLHVTEAELLRGWQDWVLREGNGRAA